MPIYDIITPDREGLSDEIRELIGQNTLFIQLIPNLDDLNIGISDGIFLNLHGQKIRPILNKNKFNCIIQPLNMELTVTRINLVFNIFTLMLRSIGKNIGALYIEHEFDENMSEEKQLLIFNELTNYMITLKLKVKVRPVLNNLTEVARIGKNRQLPANIEGVIGEMLSGKKGHLASQRNQLQQNIGISLAPRVRSKTRRRR